MTEKIMRKFNYLTFCMNSLVVILHRNETFLEEKRNFGCLSFYILYSSHYITLLPPSVWVFGILCPYYCPTPLRKRSLFKCAIGISLKIKIGKYTLSPLFMYFSEMGFMYFSEIYLKLHLFKCSCGSVEELCVSSAKCCGFNSKGTHTDKKMYSLNAL